jgi:hypothetical protein
MKDSAEDDDIVTAPVLPFRLRLAAALVRMAARWLRAAQHFATVPVQTEHPDADALSATAASAKAAATNAAEANPALQAPHEVTVALNPLMADISELVAHLEIRAEIVIDPTIDPEAPRRIDLVALVERLPKLCFALAEFGGAGPATLTLSPDPDGAVDSILLAGAMPGGAPAAPIELARIVFAAPLAATAKDGDESPSIPLDMHTSDAAAPRPTARARTFDRQRGEEAAFEPADTPWIALVERSPAARMILEDLGRGLPLAARISERAEEIDDAILADPNLRAVLFDPGERGFDWEGMLARVVAAGPVKAIAMTRCSTAQADAYAKAGFALVIEKPVSAQSLRAAADLCAG